MSTVSKVFQYAAVTAAASSLQRSQSVVVCFLGDGATEEGVFYETLNFAALKALPLLFVVENNGYAIHSRIAIRQKNVNIAMRAASFGVEAVRLESDDIWTLRDAAAHAISSLRVGDGPRLIEVPTYRWREHVGPAEDFRSGYRSAEEARPWFENDQVQRTGALLPKVLREHIEQQVEDQVADAFAFAEASPFPTDEELWTHVYAD